MKKKDYMGPLIDTYVVKTSGRQLITKQGHPYCRSQMICAGFFRPWVGGSGNTFQAPLGLLVCPKTM